MLIYNMKYRLALFGVDRVVYCVLVGVGTHYVLHSVTPILCSIGHPPPITELYSSSSW